MIEDRVPLLGEVVDPPMCPCGFQTIIRTVHTRGTEVTCCSCGRTMMVIGTRWYAVEKWKEAFL